MKIHWKPIIVLPFVIVWSFVLIVLTKDDPGITLRHSPFTLLLAIVLLTGVWFYAIYLSIRDTIRFRKTQKQSKNEREELREAGKNPIIDDDDTRPKSLRRASRR